MGMQTNCVHHSTADKLPVNINKWLILAPLVYRAALDSTRYVRNELEWVRENCAVADLKDF
jgi:hypothetical protein